MAFVLVDDAGGGLGALTLRQPMAAVFFGQDGKIIDYALGHCLDADIGAVSVAYQRPEPDLSAYINARFGSVFSMRPQKGERCACAAEVVSAHMSETCASRHENVLIVDGGRISAIDYDDMMAFHAASGADITIAAAYGQGRTPSGAREGHERGDDPSPIGAYLFKWDAFVGALRVMYRSARNDSGSVIMDAARGLGKRTATYVHRGYWRDIATIDGLWQANMDLAAGICALPPSNPGDDSVSAAPYFLSPAGMIRRSMAAGYCRIGGRVENSVLGHSVTVCEGAEVIDSVVMPGAFIGEGARVNRTIVGIGARIMGGAQTGAREGVRVPAGPKVCAGGVSLVAPWAVVPEGLRLLPGSHIDAGSAGLSCGGMRASARTLSLRAWARGHGA